MGRRSSIAASPSTPAPPGTIRLSYDRETDTVSLRLRPEPAVEQIEDAGKGRTIEYVGDDPVRVTFRAVRRGIQTDGLPEGLVTLSAAAAFAAVARLPPRYDAPLGAGQAEAEQDGTAYLPNSPANATRLLAAYDRALRREGAPVDLEQ